MIEIANIIITSIIGILGVIFFFLFCFKNWLINEINKNLQVLWMSSYENFHISNKKGLFKIDLHDENVK